MSCRFNTKPAPTDDGDFYYDDADLCLEHNSYRTTPVSPRCLYAGGAREKKSYDIAGFDVAASLKERRARLDEP